METTQAEVARKSGYHKTYIHNLVNPPVSREKPHNPSVKTMLRISRALGVSINALYTRPPPKAELARFRSLDKSDREALLSAGNP